MVLIAVHGAASRFLPAERGTAHLALEVEHGDRATAMQQVTALHERFRAEAQGFVDRGAATWWGSDQVWLRSDHRYEGTSEVRRWVHIATTKVDVRFQDFTALSTWLLEAGSELGVIINGIEWTVTRPHRLEAERELRVEAVADAITRAEAYASAIGGTGVVLQAVWEAGLRPEHPTGEGRPQLVSAMGRGSGHGPAMRSGDIEITAAVTAEFLVDA